MDYGDEYENFNEQIQGENMKKDGKKSLKHWVNWVSQMIPAMWSTP